MNIRDLNIEEEIIPFFDIYLNVYSREALKDLFLDIPATIEEVHDRRDVLNAMIANLSSVKSNHRYNRDVEEVFLFTTNTISTYSMLDGDPLSLRFKMMFSKQEKHALISRSLQTLIVLKNIYTSYFANLQLNLFPEYYQLRIRRMMETFNAFITDKYVIEGKFDNVTDAAHYSSLILLKSRSSQLAACWKEFFLFEAYLSIAETCHKNTFCFPEFAEGKMVLNDFYHPLLNHPVKNSISPDTSVVLLTGSNMSGKSTFLKSISLCVYLAHAGFGVPAAFCRLPFYKDIQVFINSHDDLAEGFSHFMQEINHLKGTVLAAREHKNIFAVFDELFKGTNIEDAMQIITITLEGLKKFPDSCFFISTHLLGLKEMDLQNNPHISCYYIDATITSTTLHFNYTIKKGWSDARTGLLLFNQAGLPQLLQD